MQGNGFLSSKLLPIKVHYILFFGGQAAVLPFLPIMAKQIGISATAMGMIYSVIPFPSFFAVPFICGLADRFRITRMVLLLSVAVHALSYGGIAFLEPIAKGVRPACHDYSHLLAIQLCHFPTSNAKTECHRLCPSRHFNSTSSDNESSNLVLLQCCELRHHGSAGSNVHLCGTFDQNLNSSSRHYTVTNFPQTFNVSACRMSEQVEPKSDTILLDTFPNSSIYLYSYTSQHAVNFDNDSIIELVLSRTTCHQEFSTGTMCCFESQHTNTNKAWTDDDVRMCPVNIFYTMQCWVFLFMMVLIWVTTGVTCSLADALCYEMLGEGDSYGRQRLWGTVGWGLVGCLCGFFVNTSNTGHADYTTAFYIMGILLSTDFLNIAVMPMNAIPKCEHVTRKIVTLLKKPKVVVFILEVGFLGMLTGLLWSYSFWFFEDLGADQTIMGLSLAVQCFLGELPFFFYSQKIINRIGHFGCISVSFLSYGLRYVAYPFVKQPWLLLPVEILHGPAYSLFYATMTSFATRVAPPGMEGSVQGMMTGTFEDFGAAVGGLMGGVLMDTIGGHATFLSAGVVSCGCCIVCFLLHRCFFRELQRPNSA